MNNELSYFNIKGTNVEITDEIARKEIINAGKWCYIDLSDSIKTTLANIGLQNIKDFNYKIYFNSVTKMYTTTPLIIECTTDSVLYDSVAIDLSKYTDKTLLNNRILGYRLVEGHNYLSELIINNNILNFNVITGEGGYYMNIGGITGLYERLD